MHHQPVLLEQVLSFFADRSIHCFMDGTVGAGGHARAILEAHPEIERFYGFDKDPQAIGIARETLRPFGEKVCLIQGNFLHFEQEIYFPLDGLLLDLGLSSMQLDSAQRGFGLQHEGPLDMRADPEASLSAEYVINQYSESELGHIFRDYGEEPRWRLAAKTIVQARKKKKIVTTTQLLDVLKFVLSRKRRRKHIHPATLLFQALRICVNDELGSLQEVIPKGVRALAPGGRFGVLAFHSLEDRIVKHLFRSLSKDEAKIEILTKKPLMAQRDEAKVNRRSRSAKLRFIEKL